MNVELPSESPPDNIGNIPLADGKGKMNLFRAMCTFSIIQSHVYKRLYSVKATKQTDGELLNTIGELDKELETWKDEIPHEFRPENDIKASHTPLILHVAVLHLGYYNCLTTIHRMSVHHGYWTSRLSNFAIQGLNARPLNPRVFMSAQLCVQAARASIHLLKYIPKGDQSCVWLIIYFPVTALVTLFANILQNPQDTRSRSDLKLMKLVVSFLSLLKNEQGNGSVKRMLSVCTEFERIAAIVLDKTDREHASRRKRKQGDSEQDAEIAATEREILSQNRGPQSSPSQNTSPQPAQQDMIFNPDFHGFNEVRALLYCAILCIRSTPFFYRTRFLSYFLFSLLILIPHFRFLRIYINILTPPSPSPSPPTSPTQTSTTPPTSPPTSPPPSPQPPSPRNSPAPNPSRNPNPPTRPPPPSASPPWTASSTWAEPRPPHSTTRSTRCRRTCGRCP